MSFNPPNPNGSATSANSSPVVIASDQAALTVAQTDSNNTGTISATDVLAGAPAGTGVMIATAPTVGSFVAALVPGGTAQADIQITGTATGIYYFEASMDSTTGSDGNWIATNYRQTGIINTVLGYAVTTTGVYRGAPSSFKYIRVRNVGGTTPSNPIIIRYSNGSGTTFLNASIPGGTNTIGAVTTTSTDVSATGSITTQNLVPAGTATAGSAVQTANLTGIASASVQVTGTYTGALSAQATVDGTTWVTMGGSPFLNVNTGAYSATIASAAVGIFQLDVAGFKQFRITGLAATTGTAVVSIQCTVGAAMMALDASIPAGTNIIGALVANQSTNIAQMNGIAVTMGLGVSGTGVQRVALAADSTGIVGLFIPTSASDVASAALTVTTTTGAFTPSTGNSYQVVIPVTVVSGTTPTLSVAIEESDDAGTNWYRRYLFPTIIAVGIYRSPILRLRGNRVRYVQTVAGTTPSFTRSINRNQRQDTVFSGTPGKLVSAATTNATSVLAAPCELTKLTASNTNAAVRYLKIYDLAVAPTVGTSIPVATYVVPGAATGGVSNIPLAIPDAFTGGFAFAITTGAADADIGAVAVNEIIVNYSIA